MRCNVVLHGLVLATVLVCIVNVCTGQQGSWLVNARSKEEAKVKARSIRAALVSTRYLITHLLHYSIDPQDPPSMDIAPAPGTIYSQYYSIPSI